MGATLFFLMFTGGVRPAYLLSEILLALPALYLLIASVPYRKKRILAFLNPWEYERGAGFQIIQSMVALGSGGIFGVGIGALTVLIRLKGGYPEGICYAILLMNPVSPVLDGFFKPKRFAPLQGGAK